MKRWLVILATFGVVAAACTAGGTNGTPSAVDTGSSTSHAPLTISIWGDWTGRELRQFNSIFKGFTAKYPWITVKSIGGVDDPKILAAINSGTPPDVVLSFTLDSVGQFCASGAWQDLNPYIQQSGFDVSQFPPAVEAYTSFAGSRCAFPFLTDAYGLYYNTDMFKNAGITDPPKTLTELEADAKFGQALGVDWGGELVADATRATIRHFGPAPLIPPLRVLGAITGSRGQVDGRLEVEHATAQNRTALNETDTPAYTLVNATLDWHPFAANPSLSLSLAANNIFDVVARRSTSILKDYAPLAGRDIRLTARLGF